MSIANTAKEALVKGIGAAAGTTVEPEAGLRRLRKQAKSPLVVGMGIGLAVGYLFARRAAQR